MRNLSILALVMFSQSLAANTTSNTPQYSVPKLPFAVTANATVVIEQSDTPVIFSFLGLTKDQDENLKLLEIGAQFPNVMSDSALSEQGKNSDQTSEQNAVTAKFTLNLDILPKTDITTPVPTEENNSTTESSSDLTTINQPESTTKADIAANEENIAKDLIELKQKDFKDSKWSPLPVVPSLNKFKGRFATAATQLNGLVYLLGGYSNNQVQRPSSTPNLQNRSDFYAYDPNSQQYTLLEDLPVAVDDTSLVTYRDRYIYVLSGWHKEGAVNLVQVFDTFKNEWFQASPIPVTGVFGHAAGIIDNTILMCDGASMQQQFARPAQLSINQRCLIGEIDVTNPSLIQWQEWAHPGDSGRFRMAAVSDVNTDQICFVGGATELYNLTGVNPKGQPVQGTSEVWCYQATNRTWQISDAPEPSFDHKNAFIYQNHIMTLGGRNQSGLLDHAIVHKKIATKATENPNLN